MNGKELIETKQKIFTKIRNFFKSIFARKNKVIVPNSNNNLLTQNSSINNNPKEQFFKLYNDIKNGKINVFSLDIDKLQKICHMLEEECKLKEMKLKNTKEDIEIHKKNIMCYKSIAEN